MPTNDVLINEEFKVVLVRPEGASGSFTGFEPFGKYSHNTDHDPLGPAVNHVLYHHIRDMLRDQKGWLDPSSYMIMQASEGSGLPPLVPGPMDFVIPELFQTTGTVRFQMAHTSCILALVCHLPAYNTSMQVVQVTHGGERLQMVHVHKYTDKQVCFYIGNNLTMEEADLVITSEGLPVTPCVGRIVDIDADMVSITGSNTQMGMKKDFVMSVPSAQPQFMSKYMLVNRYDNTLLSYVGKGEITANHRHFFHDEEVPLGQAVLGTGWSTIEGGWKCSSSTSAVNKLVVKFDPPVSFGQGVGMSFDFKTEGDASVLDARYTYNGAYTKKMINVNGELTKSVVLSEHIDPRDVVNEFAFNVIGNAEITNLKAYRNGVAYTVVMAHDNVPDPSTVDTVEFHLAIPDYSVVPGITYVVSPPKEA